MTSSDNGGYVHDPSAFDEEGNRTQTPGDGDSSDDWVDDPAHPETADREFDWRGWVLVGVIVFAFVVSPLAIYLWPPGVSYIFALIILPLFPAFFLGIVAVWATTRP
ncbi:hypothetical protein [Natrarchaeobaculum aegyptiacum]|uniref:Uncharacterized protein n=1 Tax=Natrarchaeobaculum aegyptiacum TaxID=745377 RepID=A0A2Z2HQG3_9EURY|nr:hypothetical protein [Natrarchaeobaculum aegyptiacum]ARS88903.1 hypothetical protein B1756_03475 [Natrarchaeobaculum aegyptiacum]